ncbi:hypothetical protein AVEN_63841-1 [Araneus ventricosus]|uniref:Uncharacterized protein n=1 Tax=Araneus ventricosus TaxID=182803 RepID=A0A4Y2FZZ9_ARAVE|nr:hypothetical protein AVEN_63841-1 [Araneus ventricosus]
MKYASLHWVTLMSEYTEKVEDESKSRLLTSFVEASSQSLQGSVSVPVVSRVLDMSYSTVQKILRRILNLYPYNFKPVHLLQDGDSEVRATFALQFLARMVVDVSWPWNILWSDEVHFCLNVHVNTHNCRIWPRKTLTLSRNNSCILKKLQYGVVTIYGYLYHWTVFFEEITANGIQTCSITGQRYRDMPRNFVIPQLQQRGCLQDIFFMQDGAPPHIDRRVKQLLTQYFSDARVISHHFPTALPPRSPDITTCDFWLWGFLKDNIYRKSPASLLDLRDSFRRHVLDIPADSLRSHRPALDPAEKANFNYNKPVLRLHFPNQIDGEIEDCLTGQISTKNSIFVTQVRASRHCLFCDYTPDYTNFEGDYAKCSVIVSSNTAVTTSVTSSSDAVFLPLPALTPSDPVSTNFFIKPLSATTDIGPLRK